MYIPVIVIVLLGVSCFAIGLAAGIQIVLRSYHQDYSGLLNLSQDILDEQRKTLAFLGDTGAEQLRLLKEVLEDLEAAK